jgi:hypothetical protein
MRWKCAIALWIWALCILLWDAKHNEPILDWQGWLVAGWDLLKVGLLGYAGLLLVIANEDLKNLEHSNETLHEIIGKLQEDQ